jgi:hypothetical protein
VFVGLNLHQIVGPLVGAANTPMLVTIRKSNGYAAGPGASRVPAYETPGAFTASIALTTMTVSALSSGKLAPGQTIAGAGVTAGTIILAQLTGAEGGAGTYQISKTQTVSSVAMTAALVVSAQVQPMTFKDLQILDGLNINGEKKAIYINGRIDGVIRVALKGGDLVILPDGTIWLVVQALEDFADTAGWTKAAMVLQNGA